MNPKSRIPFWVVLCFLVLFLAAFIGICVTGVTLYFPAVLQNGPSSNLSAIEHNGSDSKLTTEGVFAPGGYIEITADTLIQSPQKVYRASIEVQPVLTEGQIEKGIVWPEIKEEHSSGSEFSKGLCQADKDEFISFPVGFDIPNTPLLEGEEITFRYKADVKYVSGCDQWDTNIQWGNEYLSGTVDIPIDEKELSSWEQFRLLPQKSSSPSWFWNEGWGFLALALGLVFAVVGLTVIIRNIFDRM